MSLEKARNKVRHGSTVEGVVNAYLEFASASPALYEMMLLLNLSVRFDDPSTPQELRYAFCQLAELFAGQGPRSTVLSELLWASLHGIADLTRTRRLPLSHPKEHVKTLVEFFIVA